MSDIDQLEAVLTKTEGVLSRVRPDQLDDATDCQKFTVGGMVDHIVGYAQNFARAAQGREQTTDPSTYHAQDPSAEFRAAAADLVDGWRRLGTDRKVSVSGGSETPGEMVVGLTLIEFVTHGTDLAWATGQQPPYSDDEYDAALLAAHGFLTDEYRGADKPFGPRIDVADGASASERLMGFMGRRMPAAR